jgi:hypothetical protein
MRKNERLSRQQVSSLIGSWDIASTGKMLEVARRQGLITSSFQDGPNGEKIRLYHSWDYEPSAWEEDAPFVTNNSPIDEEKESDQLPARPFVAASGKELPAEDWF